MSRVETPKPLEAQPKPQHIHFLIEGCSKEILDNQGLIEEILTNVQGNLGIKTVGRTSVYKYDAGHPKDRGFSGLILVIGLMDSLTIHTQTERKIVFGDFSTRYAEQGERLKNYLQEKFQGHSVKTLPVESTKKEYEEFFAPLSEY